MADRKTSTKPKAERDPLTADAPRTLDVPEGTTAATRQHPALYGEPDVEVAERSADVDKASTSVHEKVFVVPKLAYQDDKDGINERNIVAVRQYMVNNGIRPDADVTFAGEEDHWDGVSVNLRYKVAAVPAAVALTYDQAHTVMHQDGPTPTELANDQAQKPARIAAGRDLIRDHVGSTESGNNAPKE